MKHVRLIEGNKKMNRWNEQNERKSKREEQRNVDSFDFLMPHIFGMFKILRAIRAESEKAKAEKSQPQGGNQD